MSTQKKYSKELTEITILTPEKAQSLLDTQTDQQRKRSHQHVARYADAMKRGLWRFDATPIKVDWYGNLIDGQHRLSAIIISGISIRTLMVYGLDPEVFQVLDTGKRRNLGDAFRISGESYYNTLASAIGLLALYEKGFLRSGKGSGSFRMPQIEDGIKLLDNHSDIRESVKIVYPARLVLQESVSCFLHYLFNKKDHNKADEFFEKLASGEGFKRKDPIRLLRDRLLFNKTEAVKMERLYKIAIAIKAWNVFRQDGEMTRLTWRGTKKPDESMPEIE